MCRKKVYSAFLLLVLGLAANVAIADIESGLVGHWPLDGDATDASGNGLHGTINGNVTPTTDRFGNPNSAMNFPGNVNSYIDLGQPSMLLIKGAMTVAAWVRADTLIQNGRIIAKQGPSSGRSWGINLESAGGYARFDVGVNPTDRIRADSEPLSFGPDEWWHIAGVFRPGEAVELYINGELVKSEPTTMTTQWIEIGLPVNIGRRPSPGTPWEGDIDEARIYNRALSAGDVRELFTGVLPVKASNPSPRDGVTDVPRDVTVGWSPGDFANTHDVYFGTNSDDVNDATKASPEYKASKSLGDESYAPALLDFEMTYYWRIDEVNSAPDFTVFTGDVWQFTTEPYAYPITNVTAIASSSEADKGPENTVNESGLTDDLHSKDTTTMWLSDAAGPQPTWIEYQLNRLYKLHQIWVWNYNGEGVNTFSGLKDVTIEYSTDGATWTKLGDYEFAQAPGTDGHARDTTVDLSGTVAKYVRITAASNYSGGLIEQYGLSEVRFFYIPVRAREPDPQDGATDVGPDVVLSWRPGREAASHDLYFSTSKQAVTNATAYVGTVSDARYDRGALKLGETYYWKINEVNEAQTPIAWEGDVWNFAIADYLVVDDMESYGDANTPGEPGSRIWYTWRDGAGWTNPEPGWGGNGTGAMVDIGTAVVNTGNQSLRYDYDNDGTLGGSPAAYYSEATAPIDDLTTIGRDWTKGGAKALTLWFHGDLNNSAEQMYVKLNNSKVVYDGDTADIQEASWHEWNIDLSAFGVNLSNVTQISIGFGSENGTTAGGSGVVYFDDIRLYPARCIPERKAPPAADFSGDCVVDYLDLEIMAGEWLREVVAASDVAEVFREGESADIIGTSWRIYDDPTSSGGQHIGSDEGAGNHNDNAPGADWVASYNFTVQGGTYKMVARVISPDGGSDSLWVRIPTATDLTPGEDPDQPGTGWVRWNDVDEDSVWHWDEVHSNDHNDEVVNWTLSAGQHTVEIAKREDGVWLDAFLLTDNLGLDQTTILPDGVSTDLYGDNKIDFKDYAVLANSWLEEVLWPQP